MRLRLKLGKRQLTVVVAAGLLVAAGICWWLLRSAPVPPAVTVRPGQSQAIPALDHVVIIMEENKVATSILDSSDAPYLNQLANQGAVAANYYDVRRGSLSNYLALTGGTTGDLTTDCSPGPDCQLTGPNIADRLEAAHKSWKEYAESMPTRCAMHNSGEYVVRHNPFVYYTDITSRPARCRAHVVGFGNLARDIKAGELPDYAFITPNLCNDMHNCSIATGDTWLRTHVPAILDTPAFRTQNSLLVITWDEGDRTSHHIVTIFAGPAARSGYVSHARYDHYALLRTIEAGFNVEPVGLHDASAPVMRDMLTSR